MNIRPGTYCFQTRMTVSGFVSGPNLPELPYFGDARVSLNRSAAVLDYQVDCLSYLLHARSDEARNLATKEVYIQSIK